MAGIAAVGVYVPRYSISTAEYRKALGTFAPRGLREKSVPGFDEDEVTMAVEAGQRALTAGRTRTVGHLAVVTSARGVPGATVAEALGFHAERSAALVGRDGGRALLAAFDWTDDSRAPSLVIASDAPRAKPSSPREQSLGAAAVAFLITAKGPVVRAARGSRGKAIRHPSSSRIGDVGAASPFLPFLEALRTAREGQTISLAAQTRVAFRVTAKPRGNLDLTRALKGRTAVSYEAYRGMRRYGPRPPGTEYSQGAYVSLPTYLGEAKARYRLVAERCTECGRLHFPPRESCLACGAQSWEEEPLRRTGRVYAYTVIGRGAAPSEFLEQQMAVGAYATAVVELDEGPRVTAMLTNVDPARVRVGMPVRMVFRRLYAQEGVTRYGFKFAPARERASRLAAT